MSTDDFYIVAAVRPWHKKVFLEKISHFSGHWSFIASPDELVVDEVLKHQPRYIFFPHWNEKIPQELLEQVECVGFHETELPYGRGGSPIQNLIVEGHTTTKISAIRLTSELDGGPIYLQAPLSLQGSAEEIYLRSAHIMAEMMDEIVRDRPQPKPQSGEVTVFKRRVPSQSELPLHPESIEKIYDHIRMLDAEEYPHAFVTHGDVRIEFHNAQQFGEELEAQVRITRRAK